MPRALNHGELHVQQVGWSGAGGRRRLVLFDLETMALLPRFTDVAGLLDALATQAGRSDRELFEIYLDGLGAPLAEPGDALWAELLTTRVVRAVESLPWLTEHAGGADLPESAAQLIDRIGRDLGRL